jgi:hypothetical protein
MLQLLSLQLLMLIVLTWIPPQVAARPLPQAPRELLLGYSAQGRPITATQFGDGPRKLVVVGNTHGAPEGNTYRLTIALIDYLRAHPDLVPPSVRLFLIPTINPDGIALGWRFDAAGVDLNRNMNTNLDACPENDWRTTVQGAYGLTAETGGPYPDSQPEIRQTQAFLLDAAGAIFLHSNAGLVFPASCEHPPSIRLAEVYAGGAGYTYSRFWPRYNITGGMHDWAGSLGIAAITPELVTGDQMEFAENLAGLSAVLATADQLLPLPEDGVVSGQPVPAPLFRYWRALGGEERFGLPLEPPRVTAEGVSQTFQNVRLALSHAQRDTIFYVQSEPLGVAVAAGRAYQNAARDASVVAAAGTGRLFAETGYTLDAKFLDFWQRGGGLASFGLPLSAQFRAQGTDGRMRTLQYLERAVFSYEPELGVRLEPLGERLLLLEALQVPTTAYTVR